MLSDVMNSIGPGSRTAQLAGARDLAHARDAGRSADAGRVEEAASMFESLLATVMVKELRKGLSDGFFGSGAGSDVFEGWLDEHLGNSLAATGALDVAGFIRVGLEQKSAASANATPPTEHQSGDPS